MRQNNGAPAAIRKLLITLILVFFTPFSLLLVAQNPNVISALANGIAAFNKAHYGEAIIYLERVVTLDPQSATGHFYLAEAYDRLYSAECDSNCAANNRRRQRAIEEFNRAYELNPSIHESLKAIAWRYERSDQLQEADRYYRKVLAVDPDDVPTLYNLAVLNWRRSHEFREAERADLKLAPREPLINSSSCIEVRVHNLEPLQESIALLMRTEAVLNSYDGRAYMSLLYRERADIQCGDPKAYARDRKEALDWGMRACQTKHRRVGVHEASSENSSGGLECPPHWD